MLVYCPECGKEISDKAEKCPNCGYPIKETKEDKDYTKIAAQVERQKVSSRVTKGNNSAGQVAIVLGILSCVGGIFGGGYILVLGGLFFLIIGIAILGSLNKDKRRIEYLQKISEGKKEILICPYCKGVNVTFNTVQSGINTSGQIARVSDNINPLHPFTHTNIKTSGTQTDISYKTLYICQDCGKTFTNPDKIWN